MTHPRVWAAAIVAMMFGGVLAAPAVARADTPPPSPGVLAPGADGRAPAVQNLPSICAVEMWACGFNWDPDDGLWHRRGG